MKLRPVDDALVTRGTDDDPRLGRLLGPVEDAQVVIVGCADDTGVRNSGGRVGAAEGPTEIRRWLYKLTTGLHGELESLQLADLGDVLPQATIEATHAAVEEAIATHANGRIVVFLGGGHDLAYASQSGLLRAREGRLAIVNVDAHLDVRPLRDGSIVTSGTPFRRLFERWGERIGGFVELGIQPQHNARSHGEFVRQQGGRIVTLDELRQAPGPAERMKRELQSALASADLGSVSVDVDAVAGASAPGVSAPPADGLSPTELAAFLDCAGRHEKVKLLDVVELAPPHDVNAMTARLAAHAIWRFLKGVATRR